MFSRQPKKYKQLKRDLYLDVSKYSTLDLLSLSYDSKDNRENVRNVLSFYGLNYMHFDINLNLIYEYSHSDEIRPFTNSLFFKKSLRDIDKLSYKLPILHNEILYAKLSGLPNDTDILELFLKKENIYTTLGNFLLLTYRYLRDEKPISLRWQLANMELSDSLILKLALLCETYADLFSELVQLDAKEVVKIDGDKEKIATKLIAFNTELNSIIEAFYQEPVPVVVPKEPINKISVDSLLKQNEKRELLYTQFKQELSELDK